METGGRFRIDSLNLLGDIADLYVCPRAEVLEAAGIRVLEPHDRRRRALGRRERIRQAGRCNPALRPLRMDDRWLDSFSTLQKKQWVEFAKRLEAFVHAGGQLANILLGPEPTEDDQWTAPDAPHPPSLAIAIYARCSADKQAEKDLSIPAQLDCCRAGAQQRGWEVVAEFVDAAESATTDDRPQFREMIAAARQKPAPFDYIVVWKFSRFSRNREDSVLYKRMLERNRVRVVSLNEPVDDSPTGRMLQAILESVDEFYSQNLAQDISRGLRKNASMGFRNGGPPPIGYRKQPTGLSEGAPRIKLEPDPQWAAAGPAHLPHGAGRRGRDRPSRRPLNAEGARTPRGKPLLKTSIHKILTNDVYMGVSTWGVKRTGLQKHKPARADQGRGRPRGPGHPRGVRAGAARCSPSGLQTSSPRTRSPTTTCSAGWSSAPAAAGCSSATTRAPVPTATTPARPKRSSAPRPATRRRCPRTRPRPR